MESYDKIFEFAIRTPYRNLFRLCKINRNTEQLCQDEYFWQQKAKYDFGQELPLIPNLSPKLRYLALLSQDACDIGSEQFVDIDLCLKNAVRDRDYQLINYYLRKGADPDDGLLIAGQIGDFNLARFFIDKGAHNIINAIYFPVIRGNLEIVEYLAPNIIDPNYQQILINYATCSDQLAIVEYLLSIWRVNLDQALLLAAGNGYTEIVKTILTYQPPVKYLNDALDIARFNQHIDIVMLLINAGAINYGDIPDRNN